MPLTRDWCYNVSGEKVIPKLPVHIFITLSVLDFVDILYQQCKLYRYMQKHYQISLISVNACIAERPA